MSLKPLDRAKFKLAIGLLLASPSFVLAQEPKLPSERSPLEVIRSAQLERQEETVSSLRIALSDEATLEERQSALSNLGGVEYDYVLANGEGLVNSPSDLARQVVSIIGAEISMLPSAASHTHGNNGDAMDALSMYQTNLVQRSETLLEVALQHPDTSVRIEAASILAGRGNTRALVSIDQMIQEGEIEAREGLGYMSLAPNQLASPFVERYIDSGDTLTRAAAISQLAYNPSYTSRVREIALNSDTSSEITAAALPGLARTDSDFLEYGLALANSKDLPVITREGALKESLGLLIARSPENATIDGTIAKAFEGVSIELNTENALDAYRAYQQQILGQDG